MAEHFSIFVEQRNGLAVRRDSFGGWFRKDVYLSSNSPAQE
jgi:hypothetical protein